MADECKRLIKCDAILSHTHHVLFARHQWKLAERTMVEGLDPAAPLFEGYSAKARLDPSDADFVDVIHSNGDSLLYGGLGAFDAMGHVDYYPNGGKVQAGCSNIFVGAISDLIWHKPRAVDGHSLCNHRRAYKFFADSAQPRCAFPAFACTDYESFLQGECFPCDQTKPNCGNMGYYADRSQARGKLFLQTRNTEPFCANQFKVIVESSSGLVPTYGALELTLVNWDHINETFQVTSEWEQLVPGRPLTRVIVAHPSMNNLISAHIKYTPYKGWLSNGLQRWAVDRLIVIDSYGHRYSFCSKGLPLSEHQLTTVYLSKDDCSDELKIPSSMPSSLAHPPVRQAMLVPPSATTIMTATSEAPKVTRVNITNTAQRKSSPEGQDQVLYFQFFPMPIGIGNSSERMFSGLGKTGELQHMKNPKSKFVRPLHSLKKKQKWQIHSIFRLQPTNGVKKLSFMQASPVNRLGKQMPIDEYPLRRSLVPDIGAQIVFVPNSRQHRRTYIPLRLISDTKRSNISTSYFRMLKTPAATSYPYQGSVHP